VYYRLTEALKSRMILEMRRYWMHHPKYRDIVDNIQGKYSFKERPQYGIVVRTNSASKVQLSADNYVGHVVSYVYKARVPNYPGLSVEWVREDSLAIQGNGGTFPSPPGVYYIEITGEDEFYVDRLLDVRNEIVTKVDGSNYRMQSGFLKGTLRLYELPSGVQLQEGVHYSADPETGEINLTKPINNRSLSLSADYRYTASSTGPWNFKENHSHINAIPGCVLAFGRRVEKGDRLAIVVQETRSPSSLEYGGRWELGLEFDIIARDVFSQQELADQSLMYVWGMLRPRLSTEGIEILDVSFGGESEEVYDENADDYFYNASFSVTLETEWSIHVPLAPYFKAVVPYTSSQAKEIASLSDDQIKGQQGNIKMLESLGLTTVEDPFFVDRTNTFEVIR
jgi:hypothetical protein